MNKDKDEFNSYSDDEEITVFSVSNNDNNDNIRGNLSRPRTRRSRCGGKRRITKKIDIQFFTFISNNFHSYFKIKYEFFSIVDFYNIGLYK